MSDEPDVIPPPKPAKLKPSPGDHQRAYRIRERLKARAPIEPEDVQWFADYENKIRAQGKSASRKVTYSEEEHAAEGTGSAAEMAAAGMWAREEGRREDNLARIGIEALCKANDVLLANNLELRNWMTDLQEVHLEMLGTVREQYLARTQAEIKVMEAEAEAAQQGDNDPISQLANQLLPMIAAGAMKGNLPQKQGPKKK